MKYLNKLTPIAATLLLTLGGTCSAIAGAKLTIDDDTFVNIYPRYFIMQD